MAHKEHLKKAIPLPGGGFQWAWDGQNGIRHEVTWHTNGVSWWRVLHEGTLLREEQPWFLVRARGEVQENIKHYRNSGLDLVLANRAMLSTGLYPDQHIDAAGCSCFKCTAF